MRLRFSVQGSAKIPYEITATGYGDDFYAACTCPASRKAGRMCKHVAALLVGDVSKVVSGLEQMSELQRASQGSNFATRAMGYLPTQVPSIPGFSDITSVRDAYQSQLEKLGWHIEHTAAEDEFARECLTLHKKRKNGIPYKTPFVTLSFTLKTYDCVATMEGTIERSNIRYRKRPWNVDSRSYATLAAALPEFLGAAGVPT